MPDLGVWELLIIAGIIILLFGSKKLPDASRAIGRSMRIFKSETKGLRDDDAAETQQHASQQQPQQPREPQQLPPSSQDTTTVDGVPVSEQQRTPEAR